MPLNRRDLCKVGLSALSSSILLNNATRLHADSSDSEFGGVRVGIIAPYAFRRTANTVDEILKGVGELGLRHIEMQAEPVEQFAGAPQRERRRPPRSRRPRPAAASDVRPNGEPTQRDSRPRRRGPGGPSRLTPERIAEMRARGKEMREWRLAQPMDKFQEVRKKYDDAGISIDIVKFGLGPGMTDDEVDYCFRVAKTLGCQAITCEPPVSETRRLGEFADKHQIRLGFHNHSNATGVENFCRPGSWEQAFFYSDWNGANVDIGHFCAGNSISPVDFIRLYHGRITNLHLKDRKFNQGPNMPWGEGDTPIKEVLQLMKAERYNFMATIELEYPTPEGSDVMTELRKCVDYCKAALT